jgi:D-alanyl-D-alanine carboxypeptidase
MASRRSKIIAASLMATAAGALLLHLIYRTAPMPAEHFLETQIASGRTPAVQYRFVSADSIVFRHDGGLADVQQRIPVTDVTAYNGFSITKTFTAVAVLQLVERGEVVLDRPAADYVSDFPYPSDITVRQLLTHSAGLPNPLPLRWTHLAHEHETFDRDGFFRPLFTEHHRVKSSPNERFAYSNFGYVLLGQLIERVSGMRYEDYVTEHIIEPIGAAHGELAFRIESVMMAKGYQKRLSAGYLALCFLIDRSSYFSDNEDGWMAFTPYYVNSSPYGGLVGTATGFARFAQALLVTPSPILSEESKRWMFSENVLNGGRPSGMALSWFKGDLDGHVYCAHAGGGGGYYAELRLYPELGRASVVMFNRSGMSDARVLDRIDRDLIKEEGGPGSGSHADSR